MAAPSALIPAARGASEAVQAVSKVLTGDLVVIKGKIYRPREIVTYGPDLTPKTGRPRKHTVEVFEPVELEVHVNPVGIGLGMAAVAAAGLLGIIAWNGLVLGVPTIGQVRIFEGFKETKTGKLISAKLDPDAISGMPGGDKCQVLHDRWRALRADPAWFLNPFSTFELGEIERDARLLECAWLSNP